MPAQKRPKKVIGVSRHGFRSAAEVALAHWEEQNGRKLKPNEKLPVALFIRGENPVRDYIAEL
jgi:hypothetical protein